MITFVFANRDRDFKRIINAMESLCNQGSQNFKVTFVDYGSDPTYVKELKELLSKYSFLSFYSLNVSHLLWNKSKALNYGILKASTPYIFIADVDLIFNPDTVDRLESRLDPDSFCLYEMNYLGKSQSARLYKNLSFDSLKIERKGKVNGMILVSRESCIQINGFDEFFHFYGAEDVDFFNRLERLGLKKKYCEEALFYHQWHVGYQARNNEELSELPRITDAMRINEQHLRFNLEHKILSPINQNKLAEGLEYKSDDELQTPSVRISIKNYHEEVEHFLREEINYFKGKTISVQFYEEVKTTFKQTLFQKWYSSGRTGISLKEVNDMVLKEIVFNYRHYNYSYQVSKNLKSIEFKIKL